VDEFQDVNAVQYDLLKRLAAPHGNFFAVGDDEQSIFTWTGADPYVLVRFGRDYGIDRPIVLDKNCRCSRQIFETARRVLAQNPQLFEKQLSAEQESEYEVGAFAFRDEEEEASWLLEDILADRAAAGLGWGDYAVLYRRHKVGEYLEGRLVRAGIPCRLARGRSLVEDDVIKYVVAALRIVRDPGDPVALEAFARCVLSAHFLQEVEAAIGGSGDFLTSIRALARRRPAQTPTPRKLWRLVFQVENLRALARSHRALVPLVDEILSQSVGPYKNALEERHTSSPIPPTTRGRAARPAALGRDRGRAEHRDRAARRARDCVAGMLAAAGVRHVRHNRTRPYTRVPAVKKPRGMAPGLTHPGETLVQGTAASTDSRSRCSRPSSCCMPRTSTPCSSATSRSTWKRRTKTWRFARSSKLERCAWWAAKSWTGFIPWSSRTADHARGDQGTRVQAKPLCGSALVCRGVA